MGPAVYLLKQAVLVEDPAVSGVVLFCVGDNGGGKAAGPGAVLVDGDDLSVEVQVIDAAVAVDEPVAGRAAGDAQEPEFRQGMFPEVAGVVVVELIGGEIVNIEP